MYYSLNKITLAMAGRAIKVDSVSSPGLLPREQRTHSTDGRVHAETWIRSEHQYGTEEVNIA